MSNPKTERWRNQTVLELVKSNERIATEYHQLIGYVKNNYYLRYELIQNPILHLISHSMELTYKALIDNAVNCEIVNYERKTYSHSHSLIDLFDMVNDIFIELSKNAGKEETDILLQEMPKKHRNLIDLLKVDTITYRYAFPLDNNGKIKYTSKSTSPDNSPNMVDIFDLYDYCYISTFWAYSIISDYYTH